MMRSVQEGQRSSFHDGNFLHLRPRLTRVARGGVVPLASACDRSSAARPARASLSNHCGERCRDGCGAGSWQGTARAEARASCLSRGTSHWQGEYDAS